MTGFFRAPFMKKLTGRFARNAGWIMAQQIYSMLLSFLVGVVAARYLGPENMGLIKTGFSFITFFTVLCRLGLNGILVNDFASRPERSGELIGTALALRLSCSILSAGALYALVRGTNPGNPLFVALTTLQSIALLTDTCEILAWWFKARLMAKFVSLGSMIASTAMGAWRIVQLARGASVEWFALSAAVQSAVSGAFLIAMFAAKSDFRLRFSWETLRDLVRRGKFMLASAIVIQIYVQTDVIMLFHLYGEGTAGYYTTAFDLAWIWIFIPHAIIDTARPLIADAKRADPAGYLRKFQSLLLALSLMGIVVGIGFTLLGGRALRLLYGDAFMPAARPLLVAIWTTNLSLIGVARGIWFVAEERYRYAAICSCFGAAFNVASNLIFIPIYGMMGAAVVTLLSEVVATFVAPLCFKEIRSFPRLYLGSFRMIPSALRSVRARAAASRGG